MEKNNYHIRMIQAAMIAQLRTLSSEQDTPAKSRRNMEYQFGFNADFTDSCMYEERLAEFRTRNIKFNFSDGSFQIFGHDTEYD